MQVLANNIPAKVGLLMLQEVTLMKGCEFWEGYGFMWFMKAQVNKIRVNMIGVRRGVMNKFDFTIECASEHYIEASIHAERWRIHVLNAYLPPPQGSKHYEQENINKLGEVGSDAVVCGDFNWAGAGGMRAVIQDGGREYDMEKEERKKFPTKREEDIWMKLQRTLGARRNTTSARAMQTCWRTGRRTRCDYVMFLAWSNTTGYDQHGNADIVNSDLTRATAR